MKTFPQFLSCFWERKKFHLSACVHAIIKAERFIIRAIFYAFSGESRARFVTFSLRRVGEASSTTGNSTSRCVRLCVFDILCHSCPSRRIIISRTKGTPGSCITVRVCTLTLALAVRSRRFTVFTIDFANFYQDLIDQYTFIIYLFQHK